MYDCNFSKSCGSQVQNPIIQYNIQWTWEKETNKTVQNLHINLWDLLNQPLEWTSIFLRGLLRWLIPVGNAATGWELDFRVKRWWNDTLHVWIEELRKCFSEFTDGIHDLHDCTLRVKMIMKSTVQLLVSTASTCSVLVSCMDWKINPQNTPATVLYLLTFFHVHV